MQNNNTNQEYNEITFASIGRFLKKSFAIALIVVVCCCLLFSVIYGSLVLFGKVENQYLSLQIEYSHTGIEEGKDPMGETLNYNAIKSASNVESVLNETGIENDVQNIINNIYVTPVIPSSVINKIKDMEKVTINNNSIILDDGAIYYASKYQVVFNYRKLEKPLSEKDATIFMNTLLEKYKASFAKKYSTGRSFATTFFESGYKGLDYVDYYNLAKKQANLVNSYLQKQNGKFVSPTIKQSFADLQDELTTIIGQLGVYSNVVSTNTLTKNPALIKNSLDKIFKEYETKEALLNEDITALTEQIKEYKNPSVVVIGPDGTPITTIVESQTYIMLNELLIEKREELSMVKEEMAIAKENQSSYSESDFTNNTEEHQKQADALIEGINVSMIALINNVNILNEEYATSAINETTIKTAIPVASMTDKPSTMNIVLMYVVVLIVSYAIGLLVYKCVEVSKKNKAIKQTVESEATTEEEQKTEQNETTEE